MNNNIKSCSLCKHKDIDETNCRNCTTSNFGCFERKECANCFWRSKENDRF